MLGGYWGDSLHCWSPPAPGISSAGAAPLPAPSACRSSCSGEQVSLGLHLGQAAWAEHGFCWELGFSAGLRHGTGHGRPELGERGRQLPGMGAPFPLLGSARGCQLWGGNARRVVAVSSPGDGHGTVETAELGTLKRVDVCVRVL